jgi:hypothetical protein
MPGSRCENCGAEGHASRHVRPHEPAWLGPRAARSRRGASVPGSGTEGEDAVAQAGLPARDLMHINRLAKRLRLRYINRTRDANDLRYLDTLASLTERGCESPTTPSGARLGLPPEPSGLSIYELKELNRLVRFLQGRYRACVTGEADLRFLDAIIVQSQGSWDERQRYPLPVLGQPDMLLPKAATPAQTRTIGPCLLDLDAVREFAPGSSFVDCPKCKTTVRVRNLYDHVRRVHGGWRSRSC